MSSFLIAHVEVRYSPLYYGLLILHYRPLEVFQNFQNLQEVLN